MGKFFFCCLLLPFTLIVYGQQIKTISIDIEGARQIKLSEIAEKITPIVLDATPGSIQNGSVFFIDNFIFVASVSSIVQYDLSGKYIRSINCGGFVTDNVTGDAVKKEIYVPVRNKIKCYDFSGKLKKEIDLKTDIFHSLYYNNNLWVITNVNSDSTFTYSISKINLSTGEITPLSFEKKEGYMRFPNGKFVGIAPIVRFTQFNEAMIVSFSSDSLLYKIQNDKVIPFVKWNISPPAKSDKDKIPLKANGFAGDFLFINYRREDQFFIYLENMKTGQKFNASNIIDDVYNTSNHCEIFPMYEPGYFLFIKDKNAIKGNSVGGKPLKNGSVIFIVKTK